ncbi:FKBP-type peptidyl-prolyl cis-trans isomerase [Pseudoduganella chitinolytica]|uniref:Peptidyl-prolyl cis-trans isomerase n=1 Tax=Pseudoduganella chitinolytica TaxID=34070 RepID=A0ABY8BDE3_9BURK|nr:FKBP-type peptidyl-prolyl cis-trans isomerase [Pseudoduganella chitinolytica]WEF33932.1 FKBP-type peptidyl-prolyl cis-trans isomerase [Pseudoduganella chitinolytica]
MKKLIHRGILGLSLGLGVALSLTLAGCNRAEAPKPADATPVALQKIDTVPGTGKEALAGSTAVVHYTGWLYAPNADQQHGAQFDSSRGRDPFSFRLGAGQVIPGWDQGVQGMKVGGRRTLIVPAAMGYGASGAGPIPPNANLIFEVELLDVQ